MKRFKLVALLSIITILGFLGIVVALSGPSAGITKLTNRVYYYPYNKDSYLAIGIKLEDNAKAVLSTAFIPFGYYTPDSISTSDVLGHLSSNIKSMLLISPLTARTLNLLGQNPIVSDILSEDKLGSYMLMLKKLTPLTNEIALINLKNPKSHVIIFPQTFTLIIANLFSPLFISVRTRRYKRSTYKLIKYGEANYYLLRKKGFYFITSSSKAIKWIIKSLKRQLVSVNDLITYALSSVNGELRFVSTFPSSTPISFKSIRYATWVPKLPRVPFSVVLSSPVFAKYILAKLISDYSELDVSITKYIKKRLIKEAAYNLLGPEMLVIKDISKPNKYTLKTKFLYAVKFKKNVAKRLYNAADAVVSKAAKKYYKSYYLGVPISMAKDNRNRFSFFISAYNKYLIISNEIRLLRHFIDSARVHREKLVRGGLLKINVNKLTKWLTTIMRYLDMTDTKGIYSKTKSIIKNISKLKIGPEIGLKVYPYIGTKELVISY